MADTGTRIKVPVAEVMVEAYGGVFGRLNLLLETVWLPLLLLLAAAILPGYAHLYRGWIEWPVLGRAGGLGFGAEDGIEALTGLFCLTAFAVRWYQVSLLGDKRPPPSGVFLGAWLRFLLYTLLLYLVAAVLLLAMLLSDRDGIPDYVGVVAGIAMTAAWLAPVRCMLLFPAASVGKPISIAAAWRGLRGNTWRLFAAVMLVSVPIVFATAMIISGFFAGFHLESYGKHTPPLGFFLLRGLLSSCGNVLVVALSAAAIAGFYRRLAGKQV